MANFKKGMEVHLRDSMSVGSAKVNRYKVRCCGKKQAILDYMPEDGQRAYGRGNSYYITSKEEAIAQYGNEIPTYVRTNWNEYFVLAGQDGWDPCEN